MLGPAHRSPSPPEGPIRLNPLRRTIWGGALAGLLSGGAALGTAEALARLVPRPSLVLGVGEVVIAHVPAGLADAVIGMFGRNDKTVLVAGIAAVSLLLAALLGMVARYQYWASAIGYGLASVGGMLAGISRSPAAPAATVAVGAGGAVVGLFSLRWLLSGHRESTSQTDVVNSRRQILRLGASAAAAGLVAAAAGRRLAQRARLGTEPGDVSLVEPAARLPQPSPSTNVGVRGVSPLFTPNRPFYRIDTALIVPRVEVDAWRLNITGLVAQPLRLSYRQHSEMSQIEADITISCVSNEVGGDLVGTARWQGVLLADLLRQAGVAPGASQVVGRSLDGWTAGFPTALVTDGRAAMVALGMNGTPLPLPHGFPARLVVPGLYGYVSATKWLREIELTTLEAFDGYWVPRGWAKQAPIKTTSRIDVPRPWSSLRAGQVHIAGMAWRRTVGWIGWRCPWTGWRGPMRSWLRPSARTLGGSGVTTGTQRLESTSCACGRQTARGWYRRPSIRRSSRAAPPATTRFGSKSCRSEG